MDEVKQDQGLALSKKIFDTIDRIESDLVTDRSKFDKMQVSLDAIKIYLETVDLRHKRTQENITDAVSDAMRPLADIVKDHKRPTLGLIRRLVRYFKGGVSK